ncbi:MAG: hypothetical protein R3355_12610 [Pseudomonas sp.]|uniref:alpha/beta fold hydrolase n=1 Tax=Pseudomonas sp. TaxID=306 RepID=UPI00299F0775|nr:hypothetical protein [Pseudomonas sp.]MDX1723931.1 hypothetical protein [Pseudomonas sp.]
MNSTEVIQLVQTLWTATDPKQRKEVFSLVRSTIPEEHKLLFDGLVDNKRSGIRDSADSKILVLIHGIRTDGAWQRQVQQELHGVANLQVHDLGYDVVTGMQLAGPFRSGPVNKIVRDIRRLKDEEPLARISVIAHSFGTYIVSRVLEEHPDISFEKIVLSGCLIKRNYPWDRNARGMRKSSIINDVGVRDIWPLIASCSTWGYGSTGRVGFKSATVTDRYFDYSHSEFFENNGVHIKKYWRPLFECDTIVQSDWELNPERAKTGFLTLFAAHQKTGLAGIILVSTAVILYFSFF